MKNLIPTILLILLLIPCKVRSQLDDRQLLSHSKTVTAENLRGHIALLADDNMKGRLPGTPEYEIAMKYVADQFESMGLKPLGDKKRNSFYQNLTIRNAIVTEKKSCLLLNGSDTLEVGKDYFYLPGLNEKVQDFNAEIVFAGYGIEAEAFGHHDYKDLDVKGKIVLLYNGAPESLPSSERAYFGNLEYKFQTAQKKGAIGVVISAVPGGRSNFKSFYGRVLRSGNFGVVLPSGVVTGGRTYSEKLKFVSFADLTFMERLTGHSSDTLWANYKNGKSLSLKEKTFLSGRITSEYKDIVSANVVGLLEGDGLKEEFIVHSAHLDHVGIGAPVNGDSIYNGAHDNASGISAMIEIVRLYSSLEKKPKRSVIFLAVTAEEMGLLGSRYFIANPTVPKENIIANVNTDMPTLIAPLISIEPLGAQHSSIMNEVTHAAQLLGLEIMEDHMPEQVRFVRSDQYSFITAGIPALHIKYGLKTKDSQTGLKEIIEEFTKNVYHQPSDELNDTFNFDAARTYVELQFLISYFLSEANDRPSWNANDFFGKL